MGVNACLIFGRVFCKQSSLFSFSHFPYLTSCWEKKKKKKKSKSVGHIYPLRKAGTSVCLSSVVRTRREIMVMGEEES